MFYYFKVTKDLKIIPFSNFSSRISVRDRWAVPYTPASAICCDENATVDSNFETLQNPKEKWVVRLDSMGKPVNNSLIRYQSGMNLNNLQFIPIPTCCPQLQPPLLGSITVGATTASIPFTNADGATLNQWEIDDDPLFGSPITNTDFATPNALTGLTTGTTYYVRARSGNGTIFSRWSPTATFRPVVGQLAAPVNLVVDNGDGTAEVQWDTVTNATAYAWQVSTVSNFASILTSGTARPAVISGLTNGQTYYFRVLATAPTYSNSPYSINATLSPIAAPAPQVFYGNKGNGTNLTEGQIEAGTAQTYVPSADISIPYFTSSPTFHWAAWPTSETGITNYYVNSLDFGTFGGGSPWNNIVTVGSYNFIINAYATQYPSPDPVQFKH